MSKHDLKAIKLQVERFVSKVLGRIFSDVPILYSSDDFDLTDPRSLITRGLAETMFGNGSPDVSLWDGSPIDIDKYVTHPIDGIEYLFRSNVDDNVSEPSFESTLGAWTRKSFNGPLTAWFGGYPFSQGDWVTGDSNTNVYESLIDNNDDNVPSESSPFWVKIGAYRGNWNVSATYQLNQVVLDSTDGYRVYVSNQNSNTALLSDHGAGPTWQVVGIIISDDEVSLTKTWSSQKISDAIAAGSSTSLTFNQSNLTEVYEGNYSLSFNLPEGKSIVSIEVKQGSVTTWISNTQAIRDDSNDPNTVITGFDNNSTQTITIKLI